MNNQLLVINSATVRVKDFQIPPHRQAVNRGAQTFWSSQNT